MGDFLHNAMRVDMYSDKRDAKPGVDAWNLVSWTQMSEREELNGRLCVGSVGVVSVTVN